MKILQVLHQFLPEHLGGIEIYVKNLSTALLRSGEETLIMTGSGTVLWDPTEIRTVSSGLKTIRLQNQKGCKKGSHSFFKAINNRAVLQFYDLILKEFMPDIIHFHHTMYLSPDMIRLAKMQGIPTVLTVHDFWTLCHKLHLIERQGNQCSGPRSGAKCAFCLGLEMSGIKRLMGPFIYLIPFLYRVKNLSGILRCVDSIVLPARFLKKILAPYCDGNQDRMIHVPYGIPYRENSIATGDPPSKMAFGYLGAIKKHKGLHFLLKTLSLLEEYEFYLDIHGDFNADKPFFEALKCQYLTDRIHFKGPYDNENVNDILINIDLLIVPSIWRETGPMVILEALASRTPVIAPNLGGMAEVVKDGENGFLFEPGDMSSLKKRLQMVLENPSGISQLKPRLDNRYKLESNVQSLSVIYRQLL